MRRAPFPIALERKVRPRVVNADADAAAHARARRATGFARRAAGAATGPEPVRRCARPDRHGRRHRRRVRGDRRRPRLSSARPYDVLNATTGPTLTAGDARRRRPRTVPGRLPRCRRPVGQRRQRIQQRRMDDAVRVRGALRRPPRGASTRTRPAPTAWSPRGGSIDPAMNPITDPLQRRRRGGVRGRELRQPGHDRRRLGLPGARRRTRRRSRC